MTGQAYEYRTGLSGHYEIALKVDSFSEVDKTFAEAVARGAKPVMQRENMPWGRRTCYVADPEGNLIEIGSFGTNAVM